MPSKRDILVLSAFRAPFIQDDITLLGRHFRVKELIGSGYAHALKVCVSVMKADLTFCWFASVYSAVAVVVARRLGIKSVIVIGGVDVAREPEYRYGMWISRWKSLMVGYAIRNADRVVVVDQSLGKDAKERAKYGGGNIRCIPTGYDSSFWKSGGLKERSVMTVAVIDDERRMMVKGIDLLFETARKLPEIPFVLIGVHDEMKEKLDAPPNVTLLGPMDRPALLPYYRKAKVYCQPSRREGFPNAICEAMLCECVPVATDVGGTSTALGDTGFLVPREDVEAMTAGILAAFRLADDAGRKARSRVAAMFTVQKREQALLGLFGELLP